MSIPTRRHGVLFVCLGNICRSPTAEAVFRATAQRAGVAGRFMIDSAGTIGWHAGNPPDWRSISHAAKRGYDLTPLRARPVIPADFGRFDWFLAMDRSIQHALEAMRPAHSPGTWDSFSRSRRICARSRCRIPTTGAPTASRRCST
jgi:protein-tyrosine phosphatase